MRVEGGAGKRGSADVLVLHRAMLVGVADPELIAVCEIVKDAAGAKEVMRWIGNRLGDWPKAQRLSGGQGLWIDDGLLILQVFVERQQETGALAVCDGAG